MSLWVGSLIGTFGRLLFPSILSLSLKSFPLRTREALFASFVVTIVLVAVLSKNDSRAVKFNALLGTRAKKWRSMLAQKAVRYIGRSEPENEANPSRNMSHGPYEQMCLSNPSFLGWQCPLVVVL